MTRSTSTCAPALHHPSPAATSSAPTRWGATLPPGSSRPDAYRSLSAFLPCCCQPWWARLSVSSPAIAAAGIGAVLMRLVDGFLSFPSIFLLLALAAALRPSPLMVTVIIAVTSWMDVARIVEAEVRSLREREFVQAGRMLGLSGTHLMFREILPNAMGPIIVAATLTVAHAILLEAYISFLGYGIQPPIPSWGNMLEGAQQYLGNAPWLAIIPGAMITIAVTSFNFIGDGLRDALDVRGDQI